jgi:serine protease inhibitor ecotin
MAHYAQVENGVVTQVIVAHSKLWCEETLGGQWVQTSYNTQGNQHLLGGEPLNKNYAGIGYLWDGTGFHSPACHDEATLNPESYLWECENTAHKIQLTDGQNLLN